MKNWKLCCLGILALLFSYSRSFSQNARDTFKYEAGIGVPYLPVIPSTEKYLPAPGIAFKIVKDKNAFRSGAFYNVSKTSSKPFEAISNTTLINAGYERRFFKGKSQLLAGLDMVYSYGTNKYKNYKTGEYKSVTHSYGISPVIGYIFRPINRLSLQTEVAIGFANRKTQYTPAYLPDKNWYGDFISPRLFSLHVYYRFL